ncbi:MAG: bifunctional UDP-N-acetylglucosamine diphosphorylase/glucosamine-1-phosphate N-acetyltransferase GlmU [Gammaproteobacteria bacterium]|jgi:bifunctional UDP-N-acetylglucosamine pyrophosphorylase/glucosamine-1-phosphate N-acetyltransferase
MPLSIIILAAGQGTRMCSDLPKVLHPLGGRPLLAHVIATAQELDADDIHVVIGHGAELVRAAFPDIPVDWVLQDRQLGTGHAVAQVMPGVPEGNTVLVMYGDVPLIGRTTLEPLCGIAEQGFVGLLTAEPEDPTGYGRILHHADGSISGIVEEKDASEAERAIPEINTGFMAAPAARLRAWVEALDNNNAQGEFYLTDVITGAVSDGVGVRGITTNNLEEVLGVNDRRQLAAQERRYQRRQAEACLRAGVTLTDPARFDLRGSLRAGQDVIIDVNVVLEGTITLGSRVHIGPNVVIRNATIADDVSILANCVIEEAEIGSGCRIGPFARIRPETRLAADAHVGNFVEIKKTDVGSGSKINHLSYIGDTSIGRDVNIGAGTITCNYDGASKHRTVIGDKVFIGSDTQLVAPVEVHDGATIGAGSTITRDAPAGELTLSRAPQETRSGWQRPVKKK